MLSKFSFKVQKRITVVLFLIIPLALLFTFTYIPTLNMFYLSMVEWNGFSPEKKFVGFKNFIKIFRDPTYFSIFKVSIYYFVGGLVQIVLAFYLAVVLNTKLFGKSIFKAIYFFPYIINSVAIALIFRVFYQPSGTLDSIIKLFYYKAQTPQWLDNPAINNYSLAAVSIWCYIGLNFIVFLGAIQSVSMDVLEAADLDGANVWQKTRYITIPTVNNIIKLNLILNIAGAISVFTIPYITTGGSKGTDTFIIETVNSAFVYHQFGLAAAMAVIVLVIVVAVSSMQNLMVREDN
jgi:ABC-type sugar transport system permease subunit